MPPHGWVITQHAIDQLFGTFVVIQKIIQRRQKGAVLHICRCQLHRRFGRFQSIPVTIHLVQVEGPKIVIVRIFRIDSQRQFDLFKGFFIHPHEAKG